MWHVEEAGTCSHCAASHFCVPDRAFATHRSLSLDPSLPPTRGRGRGRGRAHAPGRRRSRPISCSSGCTATTTLLRTVCPRIAWPPCRLPHVSCATRYFVPTLAGWCLKAGANIYCILFFWGVRTSSGYSRCRCYTAAPTVRHRWHCDETYTMSAPPPLPPGGGFTEIQVE